MREILTGGGVQDAAHANDQVLLVDVGFFDDQLDETGAFLLLFLQQLLHLGGREQAILDQGVGDAFSKCFDRGHGDYLNILPRILTRSAGEARYQSSRFLCVLPRSRAACLLKGLQVATSTVLLIRSKGSTHHRWQNSRELLRAKSMSRS